MFNMSNDKQCFQKNIGYEDHAGCLKRWALWSLHLLSNHVFTTLQSRCLHVVVDAAGDTVLIHLVCFCHSFFNVNTFRHPNKHQHPALLGVCMAYLDGGKVCDELFFKERATGRVRILTLCPCLLKVLDLVNS